jgi:hypothetical protein
VAQVIIERADGGVSVGDWPADEVETELSKWEQTADPAWLPATAFVTDPEVMRGVTLPSRRFRNAWRADGAGGVRVDLEAAKALLEAEIPLRAKAPGTKVSRVRAAIARAKSADELEAEAAAVGWKTALAPGPPPADDGEDI